jgi:hypothetical protein
MVRNTYQRFDPPYQQKAVFFMKTIQLTEEQISLLECGLRYLELNHPTTDETKPPFEDYRKSFKELFDTIIAQQNQTKLF